MDHHLSESLSAALSPAMTEELHMYISDMAEEAKHRELALKSTLQKLFQDIKELENSRRTEEEERRRERENFKDAVEAAKSSIQKQHHEALTHLKCEVQRMTEEYEAEREKRCALEKDLKRVTFLLELKEEEDNTEMMAKETERTMAESEQWARWTKEREDKSLSIALSAAAVKQRLLRDLKTEAARWMVFGKPIEGASITAAAPAVFQGWSMREEWRKLQDNKACLNDGLQSFMNHKDIEKVLVKYHSVKEKIEGKFQREIQKCIIEQVKKQEKIRSAELQKQLKLEEEMRKKLKKIEKAELKVKRIQEAKDKKEAEKLERKRAKEERERARIRRPVFCFWPSGPQTTM